MSPLRKNGPKRIGEGTGPQGVQERNSKNKNVSLCLQDHMKEGVPNSLQGMMVSIH